MDEQRFEELSRKRFKTGLTRDEADELGRMLAEKEGKPYGNADDLKNPEALRQGGQGHVAPDGETEADERREHPDVRGEERKAG